MWGWIRKRFFRNKEDKPVAQKNQEAPTQEVRPSPKTAPATPPTSKCPYCGHEFPTPKRKKKCPNCKQYMYVRTKHLLPINRVVFTEQEVELVDFWSQQVCSVSFVDDPNEIIQQVFKGDLAKAIEKALEILKNKEVWVLSITGEKLGKKSAREAVSLLQQQLNMLLYSQHHEPQRKTSAHLAKHENIRSRVMQIKRAGIKKVKIYTVGDRLTCPKCAEQDGAIYDIDTFLKLMPIPHPECSNERFGCRCTVVAYLEELEE